MTSYVRATHKPTATGSGRSAFLCCFRSSSTEAEEIAVKKAPDKNPFFDDKETYYSQQQTVTGHGLANNHHDDVLTNHYTGSSHSRAEAKIKVSESCAEPILTNSDVIDELLASSRLSDNSVNSSRRSEGREQLGSCNPFIDASIRLSADSSVEKRSNLSCHSIKEERIEPVETAKVVNCEREADAEASTASRPNSFALNTGSDDESPLHSSDRNATQAESGNPFAEFCESPKHERIQVITEYDEAEAEAAAEVDADSGAHTTAAALGDNKDDIGTLSISLNFDYPKSLLLVNIGELKGFNLKAATTPTSPSDAESKTPTAENSASRLGDKIEVHAALLPGKQQRRRTTAQPLNNLRWDEKLKFEKLKPAKIKELGLRIRIYLLQAKTSAFGTSHSSAIGEVILPFIDYPINPNLPQEIFLKFNARKSLAASVADLAFASQTSLQVAPSSYAERDAELMTLAKNASQMRALSMTSLREQRFTNGAAGSDQAERDRNRRKNGSVMSLAELPARRRGIMVKLARTASKVSRSSFMSMHATADQQSRDSSLDQIEHDSAIAEELADTDSAIDNRSSASGSPSKTKSIVGNSAATDGDKQSVGSLLFSIVYDAMIARLIVSFSQVNVASNDYNRVRIKIALTRNDGKVLTSAKTKKYNGSKNNSSITMHDRFSFELAQLQAMLDDLIVTMTLFTKKKAVCSLSFGVNCSSVELEEHWNAVLDAAEDAAKTNTPISESSAYAAIKADRWHNFYANKV